MCLGPETISQMLDIFHIVLLTTFAQGGRDGRKACRLHSLLLCLLHVGGQHHLSLFIFVYTCLFIYQSKTLRWASPSTLTTSLSSLRQGVKELEQD